MSDDHSFAESNAGSQAPPASPASDAPHDSETTPLPPSQWPRELGGPKGPEPTRYGDWERNGRCSDF